MICINFSVVLEECKIHRLTSRCWVRFQFGFWLILTLKNTRLNKFCFKCNKFVKSITPLNSRTKVCRVSLIY